MAADPDRALKAIGACGRRKLGQRGGRADRRLHRARRLGRRPAGPGRGRRAQTAGRRRSHSSVVTGSRAASSQGVEQPTTAEEHSMDARLDYFTDPTAGKVLKHFMSAGKALKDSPLPAATQELVALRVSQINGCAVCVDMHTKDAAAAGETSVRLNLVAAWR